MLATLRELRNGEAYLRLRELGGRLQRRLESAAVPHLSVQRRESVSWLYLADGPLPSRADQIDSSTVRRFRQLHGRLLDRGFYLPPSAHEVLFLSTAHEVDDVEALAEAIVDEATRLD